MHDLLIEPLVRVDLVNGSRERMSLPCIYEAMMADDVLGFPALRPHQRHAWHAFLAQLGVIGMHQAGLTEPPGTADRWENLLRGLTTEYPDGEPWQLVVTDASRPAFMQTPAPGGIEGFKRVETTPDDIDLLVTAKNHDVKSSIALRHSPEDWVFALIDVQTMSGFQGRGNYGIARMNGGFGSRSCLGFAPAAGGPGAHLAHDMRRMIAEREALLRDYTDYFVGPMGFSLLWLEPWDGAAQMTLEDLDPYFIEVCRRLRLTSRDGRIVACAAGSKRARILAKEANGNVGDHWSPITKDAAAKALSISAVGFRYDRLADLVLEKKYKHPSAMKVGRGGTGSWRLVARAVAGGQGKTEGYHERCDIVLHAGVVRLLQFQNSERERLGSVSRILLTEIAEVAKALRFGVAVAASGGKEPAALSKSDRAHAYPYARRFDAAADARFFTALQDRFEAGEDELDEVRRSFVIALVDRAAELFREAVKTVPCPRIQRHRARARAGSAFWGSLRRSAILDLDSVLREQPTEEDDAT